ncbi:MAG: enoyl-CoA hydratase-related protein [Cyclobacteriaceae bacterium]
MNFIKCNIADRRADIILNRPEKRNALHPDMVAELRGCLDDLKQDQNVKVVVIAAEGSVFSAGADLEYLKSLQSNTYEENLEDSEHLKALFDQMYHFPKPLIAQVEGHAIAGGAGLISVCDLVFCTPDTKIGYTEVKIGFVPAIVSAFLIRKIGEARATHLLLTGELFDAPKCMDFGLVSEIFEADEMAEKVSAIVDKMITSNSGESMTLTKQLIREMQTLEIGDALSKAAEYNAKARATDDCKAGIQAFLDKRKLEW